MDLPWELLDDKASSTSTSTSTRDDKSRNLGVLDDEDVHIVETSSKAQEEEEDDDQANLLPLAKGKKTLVAAEDLQNSLEAARVVASGDKDRVQKMLLEARSLRARSPEEQVEDALLDNVEVSKMPQYTQLVSAMRQRWNADEVLAENTAEVSSAASTFSPASIQQIALKEQKEGQVDESEAANIAFRIRVTGGSLEQEFDVLGNTTLESLRKAIFCTFDHIVCGPDLYNNYCFFVSPGKFYVSCETTNLADSVCASLENHGVTTISQHDIADVTFWDLHIQNTLSLGACMTLLHQGKCEHLIEVLRVRIRPSDYPSQACVYPILRFAENVRRAMCVLCGKFWARYMCFDDGVSGEDPSKYCSSCFKLVFYDEEDNLQGRFHDMRVVPLYFGI